MISLNVYLTAKDGEEAALESVTKDVWIDAMAKQPGFVRATLNTPFGDDELAALEANKPAYVYEMVSYWNSEEDRQQWATLDVCLDAWDAVVGHCKEVTYTLFNCDTTWGM